MFQRLRHRGGRRSEARPRANPSYYVNEDKPTNRATVHRDDCPYADSRSKSKQNGGWYGPFDSNDEALRVARGTGRATVRECPFCKS